MISLPSPQSLQGRLPLNPKAAACIDKGRTHLSQALLFPGNEKTLLFVGPCSVHNAEEAFEYAHRLKRLSVELEFFFPVMRLFFEKPRTCLGWKGFLYDPSLDGSHAVEEGLFQTRKLLLDIAELHILAGSELLDPLAVRYFEDLLSWGIIGARTSFSQPHRQMASSLPFPVGFKNGLEGELEGALTGILSARAPHTFLTIGQSGHIGAMRSQGNPWTHLILRGSQKGPNYDAASIERATLAMRTKNLTAKLIIDCSHGNSGKNPQNQKIAFTSVIEQIVQGNHLIAGVMLESYLEPGRQTLEKGALRYGISVTDACLGWSETEELIRWGEAKLSSRSMLIEGVQK